MAKLDLKTPSNAVAGMPFSATVHLKRGQPSAAIVVTVTQTRPGIAPLYQASTTVNAAADGTAEASFEVTLAGRAGETVLAVLVATAEDAEGSWFAPDAEVVEVQ